MDIEIGDLELLRAVARTGTLTRASEQLYVSQSALSHRLRRLEDQLGVRLFVRGTRHMQPTPAGARLLQAAHTVLEELSAAERAARDATTAAPSVLRITTECYMCYHWLPSVIRPFRSRHPNVRVQIDTDATLQPLGRLTSGDLDLAVMSSNVPERSFAVEHLFDDEVVVIVAPDHPLAGERFVRPADLAGEHLILWVAPERSTLLNVYLKPAGVAPATIQTVGLSEAVVALVKAGCGIGFMARWSVEPHLADGSLRALPITEEGCRRSWRAVMRRSAARSPYVQEFVRVLTEQAPVRQPPRVVDFHARDRRHA